MSSCSVWVAFRPILSRSGPSLHTQHRSVIAFSRSLALQNQVFHETVPPWCQHSFPVKEHVHCFSTSPKKYFWGLDTSFNKVDEERVRLAGPDRACAEWILKNSGAIRWKGSEEYLRDYNLLPTRDFHHYNIEAIDMTGADIISMGFLHLENLKHVKEIKLHGCRKINNETLEHLQLVKETLQKLEISWCPMINSKGLQHLIHLPNLKHVLIYGLIDVKDLPGVVADLQRKMPQCQFSMEEPKNDDETQS